MQNRLVKIAELSLLILLIGLAIAFVNQVGIEQVRADVAQFGIWAPVIVLLLRLTSIVIPVLPGTAYSILLCRWANANGVAKVYTCIGAEYCDR